MLKEVAIFDQPREKAKLNGVSSLSNRELIAIILRTGYKEKSVLDVADNVLKSIYSLSELNEITINELMKVKGIGYIKAVTFLAAIELSKRVISDLGNTETMISAEEVFKRYACEVKNLKQETLNAIYLDNKGKIIAKKLISVGNINSTLFNQNDIFKWYYKYSASGFIIFHNHPSGDCKPSNADTNQTKMLYEISKKLNVNFLDHIIIGNNYYSYLKNTNIFNS